MMYAYVAFSIISVVSAYFVGKRGGIFGPSSADTTADVRDVIENAKAALAQHAERSLVVQQAAHERLSAAADYHADACESVRVTHDALAAVAGVKV